MYYNAELARRVRAVIKHPTFRVERDVDVAKLLSTVKGSRQGVVSERDQLKATLKECLSSDVVSEFLEKDEERAAYFLAKAKGITSSLLNPQNRQVELSNQVAERIYDIRCKIVHTKGDQDDGEVELLLPYSPEAERLHNDIELVRFVAQHVLVASSKRLEVGA